jgi:FHA domain
MADPRFNSIHLDGLRREEFRLAREALLNARGTETLTAERGFGRDVAADAFQTAIDKIVNLAPATAPYVLMDKDYIYPLKVGLNTVGRMPDNDVVIHDPYISRRHFAILVHAGDGCEVHDFASKNGTLVNGCRINGPTRLNSGDEIQMCNQRLVFVSKPASPVGPGSQPTKLA